VTNFDAGSVSVIDTASNSFVGSDPIPVGTNPVGMAITPNGNFAYVTNYGDGTVSVINIATNSVVGTPIPVGSLPGSVAITPNGKEAYVTNSGSNTVSVINTRTYAVSTITVGQDPTDVAIAGWIDE
jgi:YVTN family beta-propeller protein